MKNIKTMLSTQARKAIVAALVAAIGVAIGVASGGIDLTEMLTIAGAFIAAFQATYWTGNADVPVVTPPVVTTTANPDGPIT